MSIFGGKPAGNSANSGGGSLFNTNSGGAGGTGNAGGAGNPLFGGQGQNATGNQGGIASISQGAQGADIFKKGNTQGTTQGVLGGNSANTNQPNSLFGGNQATNTTTNQPNQTGPVNQPNGTGMFNQPSGGNTSNATGNTGTANQPIMFGNQATGGNTGGTGNVGNTGQTGTNIFGAKPQGTTAGTTGGITTGAQGSIGSPPVTANQGTTGALGGTSAPGAGTSLFAGNKPPTTNQPTVTQPATGTQPTAGTNSLFNKGQPGAQQGNLFNAPPTTNQPSQQTQQTQPNQPTQPAQSTQPTGTGQPGQNLFNKAGQTGTAPVTGGVGVVPQSVDSIDAQFQKSNQTVSEFFQESKNTFLASYQQLNKLCDSTLRHLDQRTENIKLAKNFQTLQPMITTKQDYVMKTLDNMQRQQDEIEKAIQMMSRHMGEGRYVHELSEHIMNYDEMKNEVMNMQEEGDDWKDPGNEQLLHIYENLNMVEMHIREMDQLMDIYVDKLG